MALENIGFTAKLIWTPGEGFRVELDATTSDRISTSELLHIKDQLRTDKVYVVRTRPGRGFWRRVFGRGKR